ncbi:MAG TPA: XdhC family protein [Myxococcales bacterium LLY-WYZ-16_1]|nr:XdhC family protein [Myxococcales bacterium LLY-WYZ-16_1]
MKGTVLRAIEAARGGGRTVVRALRVEDGTELLLEPPFERTLPRVAPARIRQAAAQAVQEGRSVSLQDGGRWVLIPYLPPLRLIVVGAVHVAQTLVPMARLAGYRVTVVDPRSAFVESARFPGVELLAEWPDEALDRLALDARTAVVMLSHDPKIDDPALCSALSSPVFYVGALGSRKSHAARLRRLAEAGVPAEHLARIHGPVGLPLGGRSPAEISVSILAELIQVLRLGRSDRPPMRIA